MLASLKSAQYFHTPGVPITPKKRKTLKKTILPILVIGFLSFAFFPTLKAANKNAAKFASASAVNMISTDDHAARENKIAAFSSMLFDSLQLGKLGLSMEALQYAYKGYTILQEEGTLQNTDVLTVVDFSQSSHNKRMYIIDVKNFKVLMNTYVAHGRNSGLDMAEKFSNRPESLQSSLGFYVTRNTYSGKHGLSLRLEGLDKGFNDKAEERAVVVHGAEYIGDQRLGSGYMGRSFGCPAVPQSQAATVINYIKNGTCLFIYHPSASYLHGSSILNG